MNSNLNSLADITWLLLDIDGVMTDGRVGYAANQKEELKFFDVKDGHAVKLLLRSGIQVGALTGRSSEANSIRCEELGLDFLYQGEKDKLAAFEKILDQQQLSAETCLYIGDDLVDLPVMRRCRLAVAVADAAPEVLKEAGYVTRAGGGKGAIREIAVELLKSKGEWEKVTQKYYR